MAISLKLRFFDLERLSMYSHGQKRSQLLTVDVFFSPFLAITLLGKIPTTYLVENRVRKIHFLRLKFLQYATKKSNANNGYVNFLKTYFTRRLA